MLPEEALFMRDFKKILRVFLFLLLVFAITETLDYGLIPYNFADADIRRITTKTYDDIFVGTSHGANAINPQIIDDLTGRESTNACLPREFPVDSFYLIRLAVSSGHKPKRIIYELDPSYWVQQEPVDANSFYIFRGFPEGSIKLQYYLDKIMPKDWRVTFAQWWNYRDRFPDFFKLWHEKDTMGLNRFLHTYINNKTDSINNTGMIEKNPAPGKKKPGIEEIVPFAPERLTKESRKYFLSLLSYCRKEGIEFCVITTPVPEKTREGIFAPNYEAANGYYTDLCRGNGISYHDFSMETDPELRNSDHYVDADGHMDEHLADHFSRVLGNYLKELKK